jgi:ATP-dependent DNA helicase RecG
MAIEVQAITNEQAEEIIKFEEGHFADAKDIRIAPSKLSESVSAFANTDGGELFIGVNEDKVANCKFWNGFSTIESMSLS